MINSKYLKDSFLGDQLEINISLVQWKNFYFFKAKRLLEYHEITL